MRWSAGPQLNVISRTVTPAAANPPYGAIGIYPGQPVFQSATNDRHCSPNPAAGVFLGIAMTDFGMVQDANYTDPGAPAYAPGDEISILQRGTIVVGCASNVAEGDQAYVGPLHRRRQRRFDQFTNRHGFKFPQAGPARPQSAAMPACGSS